IRARDVFGAPSMIVGEASLSDTGFAFGNATQNLLTTTADWNLSLTGFGAGYFTPTDIGANGTGPWGTQSGISNNARRLWSGQTGGEHYFSVPIYAAVPEPATALAMLAGAGALVLRRRRA
ncbi:MAG: PEP-CTERM sorting domain-containing protein, partial [Armatimonadetes bacterium]|nr:PEP-CTERM sorting domain-containing protein [Armatimonadota bacterium]